MASDKPTRVLLTLDCGTVDADALRALTRIMGGGELEVTGLYVEDEDVYTAATLPGVSEVAVPSGAISSLDPARVSAQMANQARRAQAEFESSARSMKVNYSFRVTRGRTIETVVDAASASDLVVVTRSSRSSTGRSAKSST